MKECSQKEMQRVARLEIQAWNKVPPGLVMAILFAFVHRLTTGDTVEETFFKSAKTQQQPDYEI